MINDPHLVGSNSDGNTGDQGVLIRIRVCFGRIQILNPKKVSSAMQKGSDPVWTPRSKIFFCYLGSHPDPGGGGGHLNDQIRIFSKVRLGYRPISPGSVSAILDQRMYSGSYSWSDGCSECAAQVNSEMAFFNIWIFLPHLHTCATCSEQPSNAKPWLWCCQRHQWVWLVCMVSFASVKTFFCQEGHLITSES